MPELYDFQKKAVSELLDNPNKHIAILKPGAGKTAIMFTTLREMIKRDPSKNRVLIISTSSKVKSGDMFTEADMWNGEGWKESLVEFQVISWHKASDWFADHKKELMLNGEHWVLAADEVQKSKGYSTGMGRSFQEFCRRMSDWIGFTATPGDKWIDLMPYMVACGFYKNKTDFTNKHAIMQRYRGFPEITRYLETDKLQEIWDRITVRPNTDQMDRELPSETHRVIEFKAPSTYKKLLKDRVDPRTGEFIETVSGMCHTARQICFTKEKQEWLADFIGGLGTNCVFFCNYIEEEELVCEIAKKNLPSEARIWRIDGSHHEIPKPDTIGKYDIVVAHYMSGGEALNLQFMHYWVSVSPHYSLSTSVQARGRIKRIGQKHPMFYMYLKTTHTIEDDIYQCLKNKSDFAVRTWAEEHGLEFSE